MCRIPTTLSGDPRYTGSRVKPVSRSTSRRWSGVLVHLHGEDLFVRHHHVAHPGLRDPEDVAEDAPGVGPDPSRLARLADQQRQLLGRVDGVGVTRRAHPERPHQPVARAVHHEQDRAEDAPEDQQRPRAPQRHPTGAIQGDRLGSQLADHDVEEGDQREGDRDGHRVHRHRRPQSHQPEQRIDQTCDQRLADEAQPDARDRDPELCGGDRVVEVADRLGRRGCAAPAVRDPDLDLGAAHGNEGELDGDEVGVREDESGDDERADQGRA